MAYTTMSIRIDKDDYDFVKKLAIEEKKTSLRQSENS